MNTLQLNIRKPIIGEELPKYIETFTSGLKAELSTYYISQYVDYKVAQAEGTLEEGSFDEVVTHMATIPNSVSRLRWLEKWVSDEVVYEQRELLYYIVDSVEYIIQDTPFRIVGDYIEGYILGLRGLFRIEVTLHKIESSAKPHLSYKIEPA